MNKSFRPLLALSGQSLVYGMGVYGRQIVIYLTLPLLTSLMTQEQYGIISIVTSFYSVVNTVTNVGLPSATFRIYNDLEEDESKKYTLGTSQLLFFLMAATAALLIIIFAKPLSLALMGNGNYFQLIRIVGILLVFETMNNFGNILLRIQVRPLAVSLQSLIYITSQMGLAIMFIKYLDFGVTGYWIGYLLGAIIGLMLMIWLNRRMIVFKVNKHQMKELLSYGLPLIPTTFSLNLISLADRFIIKTFLGLESVAIFAIGYKIGSLVNLVIAPFKVAWPNFAFTTMNKPHARKIYRDVVTFLTAGSMFVGLAVFSFRDSLINIFSSAKYGGAEQVIPWIILSTILFGLYPVLTLGPKITKKTYYLIWFPVLTALINIILSLVFIQIFGLRGVALATFISYSILAIIGFYVSRRLYFFPLDWKRLGMILFASAAVVILVETFQSGSISVLSDILYRTLFLLLYPLILIILRFIQFAELVNLFKSGKNILTGHFFDR